MAKALIIDDDFGMCSTLASMVDQTGHDAICTYTLKDGLQKASSEPFDIILLDVQMPDGNGLDFLPRLIKTPSKPEVIIITGQGNPEGAELAINSGAWDYIEKPASLKDMMLPFIRALQYREEKRGKKPLTALNREGILGNSPQMLTSLDLMAQAAQSDANTLITGETGTGKELFAYAIHKNSSRRNANFVIVDCAALPETLVESVLFGHVKGAFTGADRTREGLIMQADGGTLFLDEIGELPLSIQKNFLRVLQEHRFRLVGGKNEIKSSFRLISATNQNLDQMVNAGKFRQDLLFRIRSIVIDLPPLRKRIADIKETVLYYMSRICDRYEIGTKGLSPEFIETLKHYPWPGNVRELINAMENAISIAGDDPVLYTQHLPVHIRAKIARDTVLKHYKENKTAQHADNKQTLGTMKTYRKDTMSLAEKTYLERLVNHTRWNIKEACNISGLSRTRLYDLLKKYNITRV